MPGILIGAPSSATVDLSLPSDAELMAAATPNPQVEAARLTDTGRPEQIRAAGKGFVDAGLAMDRTYVQSQQTQQILGSGFTNDGRPVYDETTHRALLPAGFRDSGTDLHDVGRRLDGVADELASGITDVTRSLDGLRADLAARRSAWAADVAAARGPGGLIPFTLIPVLQARRTAIADRMQDAVTTCGRAVADRVGRYGEVLRGCTFLLGDVHSTVGIAAPGHPGTPSFGILAGRYEGTTVPAPEFPTPGFTPVPQGSTREITPIPGLEPGLPGFVPAPDLGLDRTDQGQLDPDALPPGVYIDAAARGVEAGVPLSPEDQEKLGNWIGPRHRVINPALRGEAPLTPEIQAEADGVSEAIAKLPPTPGEVYRGTSLSEEKLARYQPGQTVTEAGFTASTLDPTRKFGGNVEFTIDSVNGKYVAPYAGDFARQQEVLFDKGTQFRVLSRDVNPQTGKIEIALREVPQ